MKLILNNNKKAYDYIKKFYIDRFMETAAKHSDGSSLDLEEYKKTIIDTLSDDLLLTIMESNPRGLFDVFDKNEIFIDVDVSFVDGESPEFFYKINREVFPGFYSDRTTAEKEAAMSAIKILNNKL